MVGTTRKPVSVRTDSIRQRQALLAASALAGVVALPLSAAHAADDQASQASAAAAMDQVSPRTTVQETETIIVTGSRIAMPELSSPVPLTSLTVEELPSVGSLSVGDSLDRLPQLRSTFNSNNTGRFGRSGMAGVNGLDLRGLGTARTLTLINGRRQVSAIPGEFVLDINTIPAGLIERVDIVTGGNSAVYGSDAIAGVVNFVTKRDFEGFRLDVRGGIDGRRTRGQVAGSFVAGTNFSENRGNIAVALDYSKVSPVRASERDDLSGYYSGSRGFQTHEPTAGEPAAGDGIPDAGFYSGVRGSTSEGGMVSAICNASVLANRARCTAAGYAQRYAFMPDGTLVAETPTLDFRELTNGSNLNTIGGLGSPGSAANIGNGVERFVVNLNAHYDVSDAFRPFVELKAVRVKSAALVQPFFWSGSFAGWAAYSGGVPTNDLRCNNPFLSAQALSTLQGMGLCANVETGTFIANRRDTGTDLGAQTERIARNTWRAVAGAEGTFNDDWRYEVSLNYSKLKTRLHADDSLHIPNTLRALDAVRDTSGNIVCRVNADADPTNNDPACAPINVFGSGNASAAARAYVLRDVTMDARASQFVASAYVAGDSSQLFELPGGPVGFVIGGEYRRETAYSAWDELGRSGVTFAAAANAIFDPSALVVKDVFGELSVPLLRDIPFAETLSVSASARMSDYDGAAGTVWAWNVGGVWAPVRDIRFRAGYSQSVRVPNLLDLYAPETSTYNSVRDPCDVLYVNTGSTTRAANCLAAGLPADFVNTTARRIQISVLNAGNPDLEPETARSLTLGVVLQPRVVPGLTVTADYYKIDLKSMIAPVTAQQIVDNCYDAPTLDNVYCALITRETGGEFAGEFAFGGVRVTTVNYARQKTRGIDMSVSYRRGFGDWRLDVNAVATRVLKLDNFTNVAAPTIPNRQLSELGDPKFTGNLNVNVGYRKLTFGWQFQYIGKQTIGTYEAQHSYAGMAPTNADQYADPWIKPVTYHNFRVELEANDSFTLYGGVDNAFDRKPPYSLSSQGSNASIFDVFGRSFYMGARAKF